jgi:hypothetical protein
MASPVPICRTITVFAFRGDRSLHFTRAFQKALDDERTGSGPRPTTEMCLLFAGHTGVSIDGGTTIYGFNPDGGSLPVWRVVDDLQSGKAFRGVVSDDTAMFAVARTHGLPVVTVEVILPDPRFQHFVNTLDAERRSSQYSYGFPDGNGDCNCLTWMERMGLPLLTGRITEFVRLLGIAALPRRRFGLCV